MPTQAGIQPNKNVNSKNNKLINKVIIIGTCKTANKILTAIIITINNKKFANVPSPKSAKQLFITLSTSSIVYCLR